MSNCPICENTTRKEIVIRDYGLENKIDCPQCGSFILKGYQLDDHDLVEWDDYQRGLLSHSIKHSQQKNYFPVWDSDHIKKVLNSSNMPKPAEQINHLIRWIGDNSEYMGHAVKADFKEIVAYTGCIKRNAVYPLLAELRDAGIITFDSVLGGDSAGSAYLSLKGWQEYEKLSKSSEISDNAFIAMQFGDEDLNEFLENHLKSAVSQTGYNLYKLDDRPEAGLIDIRMRQEIRNSKFIIADLTHQNAGSYWEAGFAEGIGKQVIYTCEKEVFDDPERKPHFDVSHHLTIFWDKDRPEDAVEQMKAAIRYTFPEAKQTDN